MIETIRIENQMNCEVICQKVQNAIVKYHKDNPDLNDSWIIIDIKRISQSIEQEVNCLEYKPI
jgi:hypothetical protein